MRGGVRILVFWQKMRYKEIEGTLCKEDDDMKLLLKILAAPVIAALPLFVWLCSAVLYCSAYVLGLAGSLLGLLAVLVIVLDSVKNGLLLLLVAYLVSPLGLPMAAAWLLARVQDVKYTIIDALSD